MKDLYVISGVTGMTGNELARQILKKGNAVIGFDNFFASSVKTIEDLLSDTSLHFFEGDLNDEGAMAGLKDIVLKKKGGYGRVIYVNCAAVVHTEYFYHVEATFQTNVLGMKHFLEQAVQVGAEVFINCSTSEVYSMQSWKEGGVKEDDFLVLATAEHSQRTSYAAGKLMTEFFMKDAVEQGKIRGCSLRFANVYSNNELYPKHILPHIITSLMKDKTVVLLENSRKNKRTFLHNYDSCAAVLAIIESVDSRALDGTVYNVATEEEVSILDLVGKCAAQMGIDDYHIKFQGYRSADPERRVLSSEKIKARTNWRPQISLDEGIRMCVEGHKKPEVLR